MQTPWSARHLALVARVLLLTLLVAGCVAGCGRRTLGAGDGIPPAPIPSAPVEPTPAVTVSPAIVPVPTGVPSATPVPGPDLSAIDSLLKDIDNDLQADASAGTNEGTAP